MENPSVRLPFRLVDRSAPCWWLAFCCGGTKTKSCFHIPVLSLTKDHHPTSIAFSSLLSYWSIRGLGLKGLRGFSLRAVRSKPFLCSSYGRYYLLASCLLCSAAYVRNLPCLCYLCLFGLFWPFSFSPHISLPTTTILYFLVLFEFAFLLLLLPLLCLHYNNASFFFLFLFFFFSCIHSLSTAVYTMCSGRRPLPFFSFVGVGVFCL